jgi:asparagine synthase (glutamine-hydrolysing)
MCGICGFNWRDETRIRRMAETMAHRGPDQDGFYLSDEWSLGHRRLSIIDLSEQGRQPMTNEDGSLWVVFNGEIFNFAEIRAELEAKGHQFRSHSDTEVILHGYEEYGEDIVHRFRGMFAFGLWDQRRRRFVLVRDRLGIKPLYYYLAGSKLIFASEIKSILEHPEVPRTLNRQALYAYLGFEFVPAPDTMFAGIKKLPAGHRLIFENGQARVEQYWDLDFSAADSFRMSEGECVERIRFLIDESVRYRLISDVPLAAFLSGGLDSSAIVAMMRRHVSGPLRTFTIGYADKTFSELDYAQTVANQFGTEHHILMIDDMTPELIEKSLWHLDEPMTDLSSIPLMLICQEARKTVTVCLSGEGGDEVFAGYDRFKASKMARYYAMIPAPLRQALIESWILRLKDRPQKKGAINLLKRFIEGAVLPAEGRHLRWQYFGSRRMDDQLFTEAFRREVVFDPFLRVRGYNNRCTATDAVNHELYLDMRFMMADSVLMKVDKMSMANSLEVRVPLLDHHLVEFMATVPGNWKLKGFQTKAIFRKALEGMLPHEIVYRGKQGYSLPVKHLLRGQLRDRLTTLLNESPVIRENMNLDFVNRLIREHVAMTHNHNHVLWGLMHTAIWHRRFFENRTTGGGGA